MLNQAQANVEAVMGEDAVLGAARLRQPFASPQGEGLAPRRGQSRKRRGEGQEDGLIRRPSRGRHTGFRACTSPSSASPWIQRQPLRSARNIADSMSVLDKSNKIPFGYKA